MAVEPFWDHFWILTIFELFESKITCFGKKKNLIKNRVFEVEHEKFLSSRLFLDQLSENFKSRFKPHWRLFGQKYDILWISNCCELIYNKKKLRLFLDFIMKKSIFWSWAWFHWRPLLEGDFEICSANPQLDQNFSPMRFCDVTKFHQWRKNLES